jgi:hypothetical protein
LKDSLLDSSITQSPVWTTLSAMEPLQLRRVASADTILRARPG